MSERFEVVIIGAGPAGLGAAINAARNNLSHVLFEKSEVGNTIYDYQLRKLVMAEPAKLPLRGDLPFEQSSREQILEEWNSALTRNKVNLRRAEVTKIEKVADGFTVSYTGGQQCAAGRVILAIGVQGTPRKIGVPGEDLPHVAYTLADPDAFVGKDILVIGAGDAAIENALGLCDKNTVSLLNRSGEFPRAKEANVGKITDAINGGKVKCLFNSEMARLEPDFAYINTPEGEVKLKCNHVIARIGCILPRKFLESCGIQFPSADPAAVPVVDGKYESNVKGLHILGALIGYPLIKHGINQGYEVIEHILGREVEPADQGLLEEKLKVLPGKVNDNLAMIRKSLPLFSELSDPQYREMIIDSTVHVMKKGATVFRRNDFTDTVFNIVKGSVEVEVTGGDNIRLPQGAFFGEMGLLSGRRRTATILTSEECILLETPRKQMLKLINSVAAVKKTIDEAFILRALQTTAFPDADPAFLAQLVKKVKTKRFKKGETIFKEGDPGDVLYVIRKGSMKISRKNREGVDVAQTYLAAGNVVGEMALLDPEPRARSATVTAAVTCETILMEKADFHSLLEQNPDVKKRIQKMARERSIENITAARDSYTGKLLEFMIAEGSTDAENFLLIDSDKCIGCDNCEKACAATHKGYSRLDRKGGKNFMNVQMPVSCRHCEDPLCMLDCPPDALVRMASGEVVIKDSCIGCGNCMRNCPYGVIQYVYDSAGSGFSLLSLLGMKKKKKSKGPAKAGKCDMCRHSDGGPACVRSCPTGAVFRINPTDMLKILSEKRSS